MSARLASSHHWCIAGVLGNRASMSGKAANHSWLIAGMSFKVTISSLKASVLVMVGGG